MSNEKQNFRILTYSTIISLFSFFPQFFFGSFLWTTFFALFFIIGLPDTFVGFFRADANIIMSINLGMRLVPILLTLPLSMLADSGLLNAPFKLCGFRQDDEYEYEADGTTLKKDSSGRVVVLKKGYGRRMLPIIVIIVALCVSVLFTYQVPSWALLATTKDTTRKLNGITIATTTRAATPTVLYEDVLPATGVDCSTP